MLARWLAIDDPPRLDCLFLRVRCAMNGDAVVLAPFRGLCLRIVPDDLGEPGVQLLVALELGLDLAQEALGDGPGVTENADGRVGIVEDVLYRQAEINDARFVVFTGPEIDVSIGGKLDFTAALED